MAGPSNQERPGSAWPAGTRVSRRSVLAGGGLLALSAALGVDLTACSSSTRRVFDDHQFAVVTEATARLVPGPGDDPAEAGYPGAREAGVATYIDTMLGAFQHDPPLVYAGGPFSNRAGSRRDDMAHFVDIPPTVRQQWEPRLQQLRNTYQDGIRRLDQLAGGDFTTVPPARRDTILAGNPGGFTTVLFQHTVEGCYAVPEYRANAGLVGWHEVRFPGDSQPRGWPDEQVTNSDGPDHLAPQGIVAQVLHLIESTSPASSSKPSIVGPQRAGAPA